MATLCQVYWYPVYGYIRRRGYQRDKAEDLTQGFFTQLLEKDYIKTARRDRGRFRSFLLTSVKNYVADDWDRDQAQKRGGGRSFIPLDFDNAEALFPQPTRPVTPDSIFERRWALTLLEQVFEQMREEMVQMGNEERFSHLSGFLTGEETGMRCKEVAADLRMNETAVRVAIHRMRKRFGELLRSEIARTIDDPKEVNDEIRYLLAVIDL